MNNTTRKETFRSQSEHFLCLLRPFIFLLIAIAMLSMKAHAQETKKIEGVVLDNTNTSIIGANIKVKGSSLGTISDIDGKFSLTVERGATLIISYIGFTNQEIKIANETNLRIIMVEDQRILDEVVVIGYGTQRKVSITGSVSSVKSSELLKSPVSNITNAIAGRTTGVIAVQRSGEPGQDASNIYVRGLASFAGDASTKPLVLVDGVERSMRDIDPNEIESFNILKDASSTAVFGVRGANGVILITTKVGTVGKPVVSFSSNYSVQNPIRIPRPLDSFNYATLLNRATLNDNPSNTPVFTSQELQYFKDGSQPVLYPNVNWFDFILREYTPQQQYNVNISGGTEKAKYFVSLGYLGQEGAFDPKGFKQVNVNSTMNRYNIRMNNDFQWSKNFSMSLKLSSQIVNTNRSGEGSSSVFSGLLDSNPLYNPGVVDGKVIYKNNNAKISGNPPLINLLRAGNNSQYSNAVNIDLASVYKLDDLVKGLSVRGRVSYDNNYYQTIQRNSGIAFYNIEVPDKTKPLEYILVNSSYEGPIYTGNEYFDKNSKVYGEAAIDFRRSFNNEHNFRAMFLATAERYYSGENQLPFNYMGVVGRVTYDYKDKYLMELNAGYNGSENFAKGKQFGLFPSLSLGYILSEEAFYPENDILSFVKFRASLGKVGNDKIGGRRFLYTPGAFASGNTYRWGPYFNAIEVVGYQETSLGNPDVTWETAIKRNVGLDLRFWGDKISFNFDAFNENRTGILWNLNVPITFGPSDLLSPFNIGSTYNSGYEFELGYNGRSNDFTYSVNANYSFVRNKIVYMDETPQPFPNLERTGKRIGQQFGLIADGFYNTQQEIDDPNRPKSEWEGAGLKPGDVRYVDVNGDGRINKDDETAIGNPNVPEIIYGVSLGFGYKGFDMSVLFQGAGNVSTYISGRAAWPFQMGSQMAFENAYESWSEERYNNGEKITLPRLTAGPGIGHNYQTSTLWQQDASYIRLKTLEIGYNFASQKLKTLNVNTIRFFVTGQNLLTWTKMPFYDPEMASQDNTTNIYPMTRVFSAGLNIKF